MEEDKSICFRSQLEKAIDDMWMIDQKSTQFLDELRHHLYGWDENYKNKRMKALVRKLRPYLLPFIKNQNF